jgi:hypothetical protein
LALETKAGGRVRGFGRVRRDGPSRVWIGLGVDVGVQGSVALSAPELVGEEALHRVGGLQEGPDG